MKDEFALGSLRDRLAEKQKTLTRLLCGQERLRDSIAKVEADIKSLESAIKKVGKKEGEK